MSRKWKVWAIVGWLVALNVLMWAVAKDHAMAAGMAGVVVGMLPYFILEQQPQHSEGDAP